MDMNFLKAAAPAAFALKTLLTSQSYAQVNSIHTPVDPDDHHCRFEIPPELENNDYMQRLFSGEPVDERLGPLNQHRYLWFQMDVPTPHIFVTDENIQVYADISALDGEQRTIDRIERDDEVLTIMDSPLSGSVITVEPSTGTITIMLANGQSEAAELEVEIDDEGYTDYSAEFNALSMRAYLSRDNGLSIERNGVSEYRMGHTRLYVSMYDGQDDFISGYHFFMREDGMLNVSFNMDVEYNGPLNGRTGAGIKCYSEDIQTGYDTLLEGAQSWAPYD